MGVKGLQNFMETCCPDTCVPVDLKQMAVNHVKAHPDSTATVVVDGMACLRYWYRCQAWVYGGQWQEYMHILQEFVDAFTSAGIRLVFIFDGTVEEQKRAEWVKRRLRVNKDIARIFQHIKTHAQQPNSRDLFCLPSGLATFSGFALKSLGQETRISTREGDYEISDYALSHNCMGILGQDTDFVIYNTVPYLSINKLNLNNMTTVLFSRERLCQVLKLHMSDLPLLACLLGNDIVPEQQMQRLRSNALTSYRKKHMQVQGDKVYAVADFINAHHPSSEGTFGVSSLPLVEAEKEALEKGIRLYLLPGQTSAWLESGCSVPESMCLMGKYLPADILQAVLEKHTRAECFLLYNVLYDGVVECSNTLEDEDEVEIPPQAVLYLPVRERIYGLLLPVQPDGSTQTLSVKEWFVFPGNPLKEPTRVTPKPLNNLST
ncbi:Constitutive coactivator of peroxisome proliferator-activated receptor gamma [Labeo rohita]|uniref:Constitutive coactivator of peroxisome proliferator-activated receptor gamma n=1 Tax=Labeo rohita TaxID=84645 RepID=A0ABQ8M3S3_LABRO|nr:Constitutive coactivator of peroxisome proliferator-activated receptor gamma [Labeo rohita]